MYDDKRNYLMGEQTVSDLASDSKIRDKNGSGTHYLISVPEEVQKLIEGTTEKLREANEKAATAIYLIDNQKVHGHLREQLERTIAEEGLAELGESLRNTQNPTP